MRHPIVIAAAAAATIGVGAWLGCSPDRAQPQPATQPPSEAARTGSRSVRAEPTPTLAPRALSPVDPSLASDLQDRDSTVRRAAVREAAAIPDLDPQVLLTASRDPDLEVAVVATEALGTRYAKGAIGTKEMIERATDRSLDVRVRVSAINGLGQVAHPDAAETLVRMLATGDLAERRSAAILLVHQEPKLAVPALIEALADADEVVRSNALESLRARSRGRDFGTDATAWRRWWQSVP